MLPLNVAPVVHDASLLLSKETAWVYWVVVNAKTVGTMAELTIYDGWNTNGIKRLHIASGYDRPYVAIPPIRCQDGLFVKIDTEIKSYTVGWRTEASLPKGE